MPNRSKTPAEHHRWRIIEDSAGFIQPGDDSAGSISHVFTHEGALLAETESTAQDPRPAPDGDQDVGRVGRLLRYYFGRAGRRVVLQDQHGSRWHGRISGTRWVSSGRVWSFARDQKKVFDKRA